jgi:hypothetical protein
MQAIADLFTKNIDSVFSQGSENIIKFPVNRWGFAHANRQAIANEPLNAMTLEPALELGQFLHAFRSKLSKTGNNVRDAYLASAIVALVGFE